MVTMVTRTSDSTQRHAQLDLFHMVTLALSLNPLWTFSCSSISPPIWDGLLQPSLAWISLLQPSLAWVGLFEPSLAWQLTSAHFSLDQPLMKPHAAI